MKLNNFLFTIIPVNLLLNLYNTKKPLIKTELIRLNNSTMCGSHNSLNLLNERGFIEFVNKNGNKRNHYVLLTPKGIELAEQIINLKKMIK